MASGQKVGERCPPIFGNDGVAIGDTTCRVMGVGVESNYLGAFLNGRVLVTL